MAAVCDAVRQVMRCDVCGDEVPIPLGSLKWVSAVMSAFADAHPDEPHECRRTWFGADSVLATIYPGLDTAQAEQIGDLQELARDLLNCAHSSWQRNTVPIEDVAKGIEGLYLRASRLGVYNKRKG